MELLNKEQIIEKFKNSFITIKESDCKKSHKGMIVTIHEDCTINFFATYYSAYFFYNSKGLI